MTANVSKKFEAYMLAALRDRLTRDSDPGCLTVSTPSLCHFVESENIQVIEYFAGTATVNEALMSLTDSQTDSIGRSIGLWLRLFHDWTSEPEQAKMRAMIADNKEMRALKWKITYEQGTQVMDRFSDVLTEEGRDMWEEIKASRVNEEKEEEGDDGVGIIHGDFWSGKYGSSLDRLRKEVLLTDGTSVLFGDSGTSPTHQLHVIDFELSHVSHRAVDLGQFIGDLLEKGHFHSSVRPNAIALVENFIAGYGEVTEDMSFRIWLHAGVHMINWWSRGRKEENEEGMELLRKALEIVARAWKRDKEWFFGNKTLNGLFRE